MPVPKGVSKAKYDSCVRKVKRKGGGNPYAICAARLKKSKLIKKKRG